MSDKQRRLARHVTVGATTYGPDDDVPDDVLEKITNPAAFVPVDAQPDEPARGPAGTASGARLASHVSIGGVTYSPDDVLSDEVAAQITNPNAWVGGKLPTAKPAPAKSAPAGEPAKATKSAPAAKPGT